MKFGGTSEQPTQADGRADAPDAPTHETHPDGAQRLATTDTAGGGHSEKGKAREPLVVVTEASATPARPNKTEATTAPTANGAGNKRFGNERGGIHGKGGPSQHSFSDPGDGYDSAIRWHADFEAGRL